MPENAGTLISEIMKKAAGWRAEHSDLPATLLILSRVKRALPGLAGSPDAKEAWTGLRRRGETFSRRRALFTAAEAVGRLPPEKKVAEWETIRNELGVVIDEGTSLHKVRALRAMSFIASDECIPFLKRGLRDESPWVQATTLYTLFRLNLYGKEPRKVFVEFLLDNFRQSVRWEWESINPETLGKNFLLNKGLFLGLLKERGGKGLALLSLALWATSSLLTVVVPLVLLLVALAVGLFVVLPLGLLTAPFLARNIINPPPIASPFYSTQHPKVSRVRIVGLGILDYAVISLLIYVGLPYGGIYLGGALIIFYLFLLGSWPFNGGAFASAERFRRFNRCLFTGVAGWMAFRTGEPLELTVTVSLLALAQFVWTFPSFFPGLAAALTPGEGAYSRTAAALWRFFKWLFRMPFKVARWAAKVLRRLPQSPRVRALPGQMMAAADRLEVPARVMKTKLTTRVLPSLRPKPKHYVVAGASLVVGAVAVYSVWKAAGGLSLEALRDWIVPLLRGPLLYTAKPYLYLAAGVLLLLICCSLMLIGFHALWDELLYVDRIRRRILSRRDAHPTDNPEQFLSYIFQTIRNRGLPTGLRVRAASNLSQVTELSNETYLNQLMDLAEEDDLPLEVRDAIQKSVDAAWDRMSRGHVSTEKIDMESISQQVESLVWQPGLIMQPKIEKGLMLLLGCAILAGVAQLVFLGASRLTDAVAYAELAAGCGLLFFYVFTEGTSKIRAWTLMTSLILLSVAVTHPLQDRFIDATGPDFAFNFGWTFIDGATLRALVFPVVLACVVAQLGHTLFLLESDTQIEVKYGEGSNFIKRRFERFDYQPDVLSSALFIALAATALQSVPFQELVELRHEKMPAFAPNGNGYEIELRDIPTDGRVVRVALVTVSKEPNLPLEGGLPTYFDAAASNLIEDERTYVPSIERTFPPVFMSEGYERNDLDAIEDSIYEGEIWLAAEGGEIKVSEPVPARCIKLSGLSGNSVTFDLHSRCSYAVKIRLVAIVYNNRRSDFVRSKTSREGVLAELRSATSKSHRLFADTLSPFSRAIWSPIF